MNEIPKKNKSDVIVQIVDARNPLLFYCQDLEKYVKEIGDEKKLSLVLVNKSDFLTARQRLEWLRYFNKHSIRVAFWSAVASHQLNDLAGLKDHVDDSDDEDDQSETTESSENTEQDEDEDEEDEEEDGDEKEADLRVNMNKFDLLGDEKNDEESGQESTEKESSGDEEEDEDEEEDDDDEEENNTAQEINNNEKKPLNQSAQPSLQQSQKKSESKTDEVRNSFILFCFLIKLN